MTWPRRYLAFYRAHPRLFFVIDAAVFAGFAILLWHFGAKWLAVALSGVYLIALALGLVGRLRQGKRVKGHY